MHEAIETHGIYHLSYLSHKRYTYAYNNIKRIEKQNDQNIAVSKRRGQQTRRKIVIIEHNANKVLTI